MVRIHAGQPFREICEVLPAPAVYLPAYPPGVGLAIGNANVAEGDAGGEPKGEGDVGDGETIGLGEGVGVGGGGIIFSQ